MNFDADMISVYHRLAEKVRKERAKKNHKKSQASIPKHKYIADTTSGIGFCTVCYSDDEHDGNHILS
jgi:hypothetical protein